MAGVPPHPDADRAVFRSRHWLPTLVLTLPIVVTICIALPWYFVSHGRFDQTRNIVVAVFICALPLVFLVAVVDSLSYAVILSDRGIRIRRLVNKSVFVAWSDIKSIRVKQFTDARYEGDLFRLSLSVESGKKTEVDSRTFARFPELIAQVRPRLDDTDVKWAGPTDVIERAGTS